MNKGSRKLGKKSIRIAAAALAAALVLGASSSALAATVTSLEGPEAPDDQVNKVVRLAAVPSAAPEIPGYSVGDTIDLSDELGDANKVDVLEGYLDRAYAQSEQGADEGISTYADTGTTRFAGDSYQSALYRLLKAEIEKVAAGERENTFFEFRQDSLPIDTVSFTAEELGVDSVESDEAFNKANAIVQQKYQEVFDCLVFDCPYDLYWFDPYNKPGMTPYYQLRHDGGKITVYYCGFLFNVMVNYRFDATKATIVDVEKTAAPKQAAANALAVVHAHKDETDFNKLDSYKNEIEAVTYPVNADAKDAGTILQLINVFDDIEDTPSVYPGYARAFQFLCDHTDFSKNADGASRVGCITVSGTFIGNSADWNIVSIDGTNYIVDLQNVDNPNYPRYPSFFLKGCFEGGSVENGYTLDHKSEDSNVQNIVNHTYRYDERTKSVYSEEALTIGTESYPQPGMSGLAVTSQPPSFNRALSPDTGMSLSLSYGCSLSGGSDCFEWFTVRNGEHISIGHGSSITITDFVDGMNRFYCVAHIGGKVKASNMSVVSVKHGVVTPRLTGATGTTPYYKMFDGTTSVPEEYKIVLDGVLEGHDVAIDTEAPGFSLAYDNSNAGTDRKIIAKGISLKGADAQGYVLAKDGFEVGGSINPANISETNVSGVAGEYAYTGEEIRPELTLCMKSGYPLAEDVDYRVTYRDNVAPGTATIVIEATEGNFTGTMEIPFTIVGNASSDNAGSGGGAVSGGGGGGGTPSAPPSTVVTNPDGSTTTTVAAADGTTTETTAVPDGTNIVKVTSEDGSSVTTTTSADGVSAAVSCDAAGVPGRVEATVPESVALEASAPVALPMEAIAADAGALITVQAKKDAPVAVPVAAVEPGDVLVAVASDGTETVVAKSTLVDDALAFAMPEDVVTLKVVNRAVEFSDVDDGDWYEHAGVVDFITSRGLIRGVDVDGGVEFQGDATMTRAMFATVLNRLEGGAAPLLPMSFADIPSGNWYTESVAWAVETGLVKGYDSAVFGPHDDITREQMAVIMMRYAESAGRDTTNRADIGAFYDAGELTYGREAMEWAVAEGLLKGYEGSDQLGGTANATRAEVSTVFERMINYMLGVRD